MLKIYNFIIGWQDENMHKCAILTDYIQTQGYNGKP